MQQEIRELKKKKLVGIKIKTSLSENVTPQLWQQFMSRRNEIKNDLNTGLYSVQVYDGLEVFSHFTENTLFDKWAAVEVSNYNSIPEGFESLSLSGGKYAVFLHKGPANSISRTFQYIFGTWLPNSDYELDDREHFEIMGDKYYGPDNPDSEEEVWIPVK